MPLCTFVSINHLEIYISYQFLSNPRRSAPRAHSFSAEQCDRSIQKLNRIHLRLRLQHYCREWQYNLFDLDNPNSKKQRIFDEVGMIELTTRMLEIIHKRDFEEG